MSDIISFKDIVGDEISIVGPAASCFGCQTSGHWRGECLVVWGAKARPLPGFDKDADRIPAKWQRGENVPKKVTYAEWVNFFKDATLFSSRLTGQAEESGIPGAPPLGAFEERAANART